MLAARVREEADADLDKFEELKSDCVLRIAS